MKAKNPPPRWRQKDAYTETERLRLIKKLYEAGALNAKDVKRILGIRGRYVAPFIKEQE